MTQEIIPAYSTFQKDIDLTLYHAFAELVVQTAQDGEARILYRQLEARQIWQEDQNVSSYFEAYSLRYPGEVLERFEEKLGTDIRILRALALALGYTRRCQADTMFVGNQRNDFIQKLRRTGRDWMFTCKARSICWKPTLSGAARGWMNWPPGNTPGRRRLCLCSPCLMIRRPAIRPCGRS